MSVVSSHRISVDCLKMFETYFAIITVHTSFLLIIVLAIGNDPSHLGFIHKLAFIGFPLCIGLRLLNSIYFKILNQN